MQESPPPQLPPRPVLNPLIQQAQKLLAEVKAGKIIQINDWLQMKSGLTRDQYQDAIKGFVQSSELTAKEKFLKSIREDREGRIDILTDIIPKKERTPTGQPLEEEIKVSGNPARAKRALDQLKVLQADKKSSNRLTDPLIEILVWGVANSRSSSEVGKEGILGVEQALNAAEALIAMPLQVYMDIVIKLNLTGGTKSGWDQRQVESALILKGLAARKTMFDSHSPKASQEIGRFAQEIRDKPTDELINDTSVRDIGDSKGLKQQFTMTCGPTSIQIIKGEADPIYALQVSNQEKKKYDLTGFETSVARDQKRILEKSVVPRYVYKKWTEFTTKTDIIIDDTSINISIRNGLHNFRADLEGYKLLGLPNDSDLKEQGIETSRSIGFEDKDFDSFKNYKPWSVVPGMYEDTFDDKSRMELLDVTAGEILSREHLEFTPVGESENYPTKNLDASLADLWEALDKGRDIGVTIYYSDASGGHASGGHYMVFTDCKGSQADPQFLLSDPWNGTSKWFTMAELKNGEFNKFPDIAKGYIGAIYL
jgi:hypothetical protein